MVAPESPADPDGEWRVYDAADPETRRDITADALAALATYEPARATTSPRSGAGPTRGFVIPSDGA